MNSWPEHPALQYATQRPRKLFVSDSAAVAAGTSAAEQFVHAEFRRA